MPTITRKHKRGTRFSDEELWYCEELARRYGSTDAGIMRQGVLRWAHADGLVYPERPATPEGRKSKKPRKPR